MPGVCPMTSICANCLHGLADRVEALRVALERIVDEKVDDSRDPWAIVAMFRVISRNALRRNRTALRGEEEVTDEEIVARILADRERGEEETP